MTPSPENSVDAAANRRRRNAPAVTKMQDRPAAEALLRDLRDLFRERGADRLPSDEAAAALSERLGGTITPTRLTRALKPLGAAPRQFRVGGRPRWGYLLADLVEARDAGITAPPPMAPMSPSAPPPSPPAEGPIAAPPAENHAAAMVKAPASAATRPRVGIAAVEPLDAAAEWNLRLAMVAAGH